MIALGLWVGLLTLALIAQVARAAREARRMDALEEEIGALKKQLFQGARR
jgi:hypothetical protein